MPDNRKYFRKEFIDHLIDLNEVPDHLIRKWYREDFVLLDSLGNPVWPVGLPNGLPFHVLARLSRELTSWTRDAIGIYNPANLGKINIDYPSEHDH